MNEYHREQSETIIMVRDHLKLLTPSSLKALKVRTRNYLKFREDVDAFLQFYFSDVCSETCFRNHYSACCGREGITTFFADVVINLLMSSDTEIDGLLEVLAVPNFGLKCVYLGEKGCLWCIKPIVCEMFLCERARKAVYDKKPGVSEEWDKLKAREKRYTWPDRPVLFDYLETYFINRGCHSSLMYFHNSPGLLRVKEKRNLHS